MLEIQAMQQELAEQKKQKNHQKQQLQEEEASSNFVDEDELTEDGEEKSCWDRLIEHNDFRQYQKLSVAIHRNGDATPCAQTDPVLVTADQLSHVFKKALGDLLGGEHPRQRKCSESFFQDKYKMESLLTRVVHYLLLDVTVSSSCGFGTNALNDTKNSSSSSSPGLGFYDYCDGGPERKTPILRDHNHLVRIPVPSHDGNAGNTHQRLVLPCHFHALNGERITSMKFLDELVRHAPKQQVDPTTTLEIKEGGLVMESSSQQHKNIQQQQQQQHPEITVLSDEMAQASPTEEEQSATEAETCLANDTTCLATFSTTNQNLNADDDEEKMNHRRLQAVNDDGQNANVNEEKEEEEEEEDDDNEEDEDNENDSENAEDDGEEEEEDEEEEENSESAEPYVTVPLSATITNYRTLHLVAVPAGRLFRFSPPARLGQSIPLPSHVKGANLSQTMSLTALSLSPLVFEIINFSNDEETSQLLQDVRSAGESFVSQVDDKGMAIDVMSNFESTVAKRIKRRSCLVAGFDYYMESHTEGLQIIRYNTTNAYQSPHTDFIAPNDLLDMDLDSSRTGGNRFATFVLYLSDHGTKDGGETVFTEADSGDPGKFDEMTQALKEFRSSTESTMFEEGSWQESLVRLRILHTFDLLHRRLLTQHS